MRIPFQQLKSEFRRVLLKHQFSAYRAEACAHIFAENSRDGVYTHGLNRFPAFIEHITEGLVNIHATPTLVDSMGAIERWDGNLGPGVLNATSCMNQAVTLAGQYGIGCVALRNTNHWMRGGTYGWQAAEAGYISISFTNTIANLPPWGGIDPRLGNNPLVIAIPRKDGHVVLDMAITQYSFGKLHQYKNADEQLPLPGGYDEAGQLTNNPAAIIQSKRPLPIGFWKGSGLSLVLDLLATVLSKGNSTEKITQKGKESGVSQVFICIKPDGDEQVATLIEEIITYTKTSRAIDEQYIQYPGEGTLKTRERNMQEGIPVDERIWQQVLAM